jgi:quinoprotein glucose dehydrogenase
MIRDKRAALRLLGLGFLLSAARTPLAAQTASAARATVDPPAEWHSYNRDLLSTRYSPLSQIDRTNVAKLALAFRWRPDSGVAPPEFKNESTPLMIHGTLYFPTALNRDVVAADAATGRQLWRWHQDENDRAAVAPRRGSGRGVSYWTDGKEERIFVVTPGYRLIALDAKTGAMIESFGVHGAVDLKLQIGVPLDPTKAAIGSSSPPLVFEDILVIGPALEVGSRPVSYKNVPGRILALDARTGKLRWRFNTIPTAGEFGVETWENDSWTYTGNTGAWAPLTLDPSRGWLYLPVEAATGDYYGGHRLGDNLFSTTLLCVDVRTGKRIWHYQTVHHDIWDYDNPTAPILADIDVDGKKIQAVVQLTKQSFAYVFDRVTGKPVWPIVEKPVPASDVPGERAAATQPFPTKPPAFDRQGVSVDDLIDFTPELRAQALEIIKPYHIGPLFTPATLLHAPDGTKGLLSLPGSLGGADWEGGAVDPETGVVYVGSHTAPSVLAMGRDSVHSDMNVVNLGGGPPTVQGLPLLKPPYSRITAIDLNRGEFLWQKPSGDTPDRVKNNPAMKGIAIPTTGGFARPVVLVTKTLLFAGEGWGGEPVLRALDKKTGEVLWSLRLPGSVSSVPMTYALGGKQYVAFWVDDQRAGVTSELLAFAIP